MAKGVKSIFWANDNTVKIFRELCKKSESRPLIKWKRFRKLDKNNVFKNISNTQLCSMYRKFWLMEKGICPKCGKYYLEKDQLVCSICVENNKKYVIDFHKRKAKNAK